MGMPGTGKTTFIAALINSLIKDGKSVVLTSFTHTAVDNVLIKCLQYDLQFIRIGNESKVNERIRPFCTSRNAFTTIEEVKEYYGSSNLVAVTSSGIKQ